MILFQLLIFLLFVSFIQASGEFAVLHSPKAIEFRGNAELESFYVGDVILACMGNSVTGNSKWSGMQVQNPFPLANTTVVVVHIQGVFRVQTHEMPRIYELTDSETQSSLNSFVLQVGNKSVTEFNFCNHSKGVQEFQSHFGDLEIKTATPSNNFEPNEFESHQHFLDEIAYMHAIANNLTLFLGPGHVVIIRLSLESVTKIAKYAVLHDVKEVISDAVAQLLTAAKNFTDTLLFVQTTDKHLDQSPTQRGAQSQAPKDNPFDDMSGSDFPIVFNIVLWLSLALGLALAVICYLIANIDPGRDSIIYRISYAYKLHKKKH